MFLKVSKNPTDYTLPTGNSKTNVFLMLLRDIEINVKL